MAKTDLGFYLLFVLLIINYFFMKNFKKFVSFVLVFSFISFNVSPAIVLAVDEQTEVAPETIVTPVVEEETTPPVEEEIIVQEEQNNIEPTTNNQTKINICHKNGNSGNWNALNVDENGWGGHSGHDSDYLYNGPLGQNGKPTNDGNDWCEDNAPTPPQAKGSITVCKVILGPDGAPISSAPGSTFTINNDFGSPAVFTTPMVINTKLFSGDHGNDANCIEYNDLPINPSSKTTFHYQAEVTTGSSWESPLYRDLFNNVPNNLSLNNLLSFKEWSANEDGADGEISLYNLPVLKHRTLVIINRERTAQISAAKIICPTEDLLPNWGAGAPDITAATVSEFLATHPTCHEQSGWKYEWAVDGTANPGDNVEVGGGAWQVFDENNLPEVPVGSRVWVREQIPSGYIPFSGATSDLDNPTSKNSAEFYCSTDVLNYDNYEWVDVTQKGIEYHCVAFNVPTENQEPPQCNPEVNLIENGDFEAPVIAPGVATGWDIIADSNPLLKWLVAWANPQDDGRLGLEIQDNVAGAPFGGSQHAELDGDHPTTIWQNIDTIPGKEYSFSFKYSPHPGRDLADDSLQVKIDGSVLGSNIATDGTGNGNTVWESITRTFVAIGATTKVEIYDNGTDTSFGGYVDDADLRCVGDPQEPCDEDASQVVVSNSSTQVDGHDALPLTFIHPAWTASIPDATWIWATDPVESPTNDADLTKTFTKTFTIVGTPTSGTLDIAADNNYSAKVNGSVVPVVFDQNNFQLATQDSYDVSAFLISGVNTIEIKVTNKEIGEDANPANNPAGLMYKLTVHNNECQESPRTARITVIKNTGSSVDNGTFHFTGLDGDDGFDLTTAVGTASSFFDVFADYNGESYTITEVVPQGWNLTSTYCEYDNESFGVAVENGKTVTVDPGDQITCTFTNQKQVIEEEPTGSIQITKYVCPANTTVVRSVNGVGGIVPEGCVLQSGKTFGYVHGSQTDANGPYPELSEPLTVGGTTASGVLTISNLPATGRYLVVETDSNNIKIPDGDIFGLYCQGDGDTSNNNDNQELTFVPNDGTAHCVAYNKASVVIETDPAQCSDESDNDEDGLNNASDPGCHSDRNVNNSESYNPLDDDESNESFQCSDGISNDSDGLIDSLDPGCQSGEGGSWDPNDNDETNSSGPTPTVTTSGGGGGGSWIMKPAGQVLGAETSCGIYVDKFLRRGYKNDTEAVKKLQKFLNDYMKSGLKEDGKFGLSTEKALKKFQSKHADKILNPWGFKAPTGIFYITTQTEVNNIMCPDLKLQIPPLTPIELNPLAPKKED